MEELNVQLEKFNHLLKNQKEFSLYEQLTLANHLKNKVILDEIITSACQIDIELAEQRRVLLEQINAFIDDIIKRVISCKIDPTYDNRVVIPDFSAAKKKLEEIISEEVNKTIFSAEKDIFVDIPDISKYIQSLSTIKENCQKNRYTVLLMGEFQSGKTTTLDALCDGRHIGAIGDGTATSAVPVSVSYAEKEDVNPVWKTNEELKLLFSSLTQCIEEFDYNEFNINDIEERKTWLTKIDEFRNNKDCPQDVKILALCSLVLKFYGTDELEGKIDSKIQITDVASVTRFPEKLETRWKKSGSSAFPIEEAIFLFIAQIECFLPSETLKRLNCTIIDCPGLFNNTYDTSVTEIMMAKVHAIVYLLPYHRGIGEDVCKSLYTIQKNYPDVHRKLFVTQNISSKRDNAFVDSNRCAIESMFGNDKQVTLYDAHLAYLSSVYYYQEQLPQADIQHFCRDVIEHKYDLITRLIINRTKKFQNFDEAWNYHFKGYMTANEWVDIPSPEYLKKASGIENFISDLRTFIENNEAYSVILSNGVYELQSEMIRIKSDLYTRYVEPKILGREQVIALWENRLRQATNFKVFSEGKLNNLFFSSQQALLPRLTQVIYKKIFTDDFYISMYDAISDILYNNKGKIAGFMTLRGFDKDTFRSYITPYITECICTMIKGKFVDYWYPLLYSGQDQNFKNIFTPNIKILEMELLRNWETQYFSNDKEFVMQKYISIYDDIKLYLEDSQQLTIREEYGRFGTNILQGSIFLTLISEIVVEIQLIATGVAATLAGMIAVMGGAAAFTWPIILIGGTLAIPFLVGKTKDWIKNQFKKMVQPDLENAFIENNIHDKLKVLVESEIKRILNLCQTKLSLDIKKMEKERDVAIYTPVEQIEDRCFHAVHTINAINEQLVEYENFKKQYVKYE